MSAWVNYKNKKAVPNESPESLCINHLASKSNLHLCITTRNENNLFNEHLGMFLKYERSSVHVILYSQRDTGNVRLVLLGCSVC